MVLKSTGLKRVSTTKAKKKQSSSRHGILSIAAGV